MASANTIFKKLLNVKGIVIEHSTFYWTCQEKCSRETPKVWNWMKFETERSVAEWSFKFRRLLMRPAPDAFCERPPAASRPDCSCRLEAGCSK